MFDHENLRIGSYLSDLLPLTSKLSIVSCVSPLTNNQQEVVETCVAQKSQEKIDSANGSPGMEGPEIESKHSSYFTTSGSVETTQQGSRSSQDVKETGMDVVERPHRFSSPDLNLNLDSNPDTDSHRPRLNVVNSPKSVSVLGAEVQTSVDRPPFPLHFRGPGSDMQSPRPTLRLP